MIIIKKYSSVYVKRFICAILALLAFFLLSFICYCDASLNFKNMQCGTRFTSLSHCQFVFIELVLLLLFHSFSLSISHTYSIMLPRQLSIFSHLWLRIKYRVLYASACHALIRFVVCADRTADMEKSRCFKQEKK